jgi:hypothetical protein
MRKIILSRSLAAFAASVQAGDTNTTSKATGDKDKAGCAASASCCPKQAEAGKCPAGGDAKPADCPKTDAKAAK